MSDVTPASPEGPRCYSCGIEPAVTDGLCRTCVQQHRALPRSPEGPRQPCPSGACDHYADAHADIGRGLCLVRGCHCPRSPEGPDERLRGQATAATLPLLTAWDGDPFAASLPELAGEIADAIMGLPLLTAERERADEAEQRYRGAVDNARTWQSRAVEARERADRLAEAFDRAAIAAISQAAVAWGYPLLDILQRHGHDHDCDAVTADNLTLCDCWWGEVKRAAEGMSLIATAADDALSATDPGSSDGNHGPAEGPDREEQR